MTKFLAVLFVLAAGCGGKKSAAPLSPTSGSAKPADLRPADGSEGKPETKDASSEEDPCAVPPSQ